MLRRVRDIAMKSSKTLFENQHIPIEDIEIISVVIEEFIDNFHHGKEESAYFPETKDKDNYAEEVRKFLIEHEFGRRIAKMLRSATTNLRSAEKNKQILHGEKKDMKEPVARFLRTYAIFIDDHTGKEDRFFDDVEELDYISPELDTLLLQHYENCKVKIGGEERISQMIKLIEYLENCEWMKK
jgi:hemerythrin-like domain-containing protein